MLKCKDMPALSDDYLENTLPFKKKTSVALHLAICKHCRCYLKNLKATIDVVRMSNANTVESRKINAVMHRIEVDSNQPPS